MGLAVSELRECRGPCISTPASRRAEVGYYAFRVDLFLKEDGIPTTGEIHGAPLVKVHAKRVDTRTATLLWEGRGESAQASSETVNILLRDHLRRNYAGHQLEDGPGPKR